MTETIKSIGSGILAGLVVLLGSMVLGGSPGGVGGVYNNVTTDFSEGISVDGTVVIDGSGNIDAPITSGSNGSFSGTATTSVTIQGTTASCLIMKDAGGTTRYFRPNEAVVGGMGTTTAAYCGF